MRFWTKVYTSIKFRTRYFLFSNLGLPSSSFSSLFFETVVNKTDQFFQKKHGVSLSISLKPINDIEQFIDSNFGIVLHGKVYDDVFLIRNIRWLRQAFPNSPIVLSSYTDDISSRVLEACKKECITVSLIREPGQLTPPYAVNFVRALSSAHNGIVVAQSLGALRVMKLRVDQEITRVQGVKIAVQILSGKILLGDNSCRIIGTSYNSYKTPPLFLSDMLQIGKVEEMLRYWEPFESKDIEGITDSVFALADEVLIQWKAVPEVWLAVRYMHNLGLKVQSSEKLNLEFWLNHAAVIDSASIGQNWLKSINCLDSNYASIKWFEESYNSQYLELHFSDWLLMVLESRRVINDKNLSEN